MSSRTHSVQLGFVVPYAAWLLDAVFGAGVGVSDVISSRKAFTLVSCLQWTSRKLTLSKWTRRRCPSRHLNELCDSAAEDKLVWSSHLGQELFYRSDIDRKSRYSRYLTLKVPLIAPMSRPTTVKTVEVDLVRFAWD